MVSSDELITRPSTTTVLCSRSTSSSLLVSTASMRSGLLLNMVLILLLGIFMALITAIVLFSILGVGLRALASLEVSYGAFDKDMGPAAQKKQQ